MPPMLLGAHCSPKNESGLSSEPQTTIEFARISPRDIGTQPLRLLFMYRKFIALVAV